jgi:hypothetical protein
MLGFKLYIFLLSVLAILFCGCDIGSTNKNFEPVSSKNIEECVEPSNPYNDGGGHDAGFNWAMENGGECDGRSDSFNEGCEEYYRQLNKYNDCLVNNK